MNMKENKPESIRLFLLALRLYREKKLYSLFLCYRLCCYCDHWKQRNRKEEYTRKQKTGFIHENVLFCALRDFILKRVFILHNKSNSIYAIVEAVTGINRE